AAVDGVRPVVVGTSAVQDDVALSDEGEVDAAAADDDPERAADDAEANLRPAPHRGRVGLVLRPVVAGDDRPGAVAVDRVVDHDLAFAETSDHPAAPLDRD